MTGDPLALFLFLIAAEGLAGMMRNAVELGLYKHLHMEQSISFSLLQFADDTILVGENSWDNLWSIKAILCELVSCLRVNFAKSNLFGINSPDNFLVAASHFLSCSIGSLPFKFLGVPVGANPMLSTWKPIIDKVK